jgi:hypothetical protein
MEDGLVEDPATSRIRSLIGDAFDLIDQCHYADDSEAVLARIALVRAELLAAADGTLDVALADDAYGLVLCLDELGETLAARGSRMGTAARAS